MAPSLRDIRALGQKGAAEPYSLSRLYGRRLSPYFTYLLVRTAVSPNGVTWLGIGLGIGASALLWLPLTGIHLFAAALYQVSYVLDFSDGEVARLRNTPSHAGAYLDWLGHFYVPTIAAGMLGLQLANETGRLELALLGLASAIGLSAFHFSCKEHIVIAYLRKHPAAAPQPAVQNAMRDRPHASALSVPDPVRTPRPRALVAAIGSTIFYPGATHLLSLAIVLDLMLLWFGLAGYAARASLLVVWTAGFVVHAVLAVRRNFRVLQALDGLPHE
jgi:phosphatidylglycerophosphate synthase